MIEVPGSNDQRFNGFADDYHKYRMPPPEVILQLPNRYAQLEGIGTVVDLGCGTGLSTLCWSNVAARVVGIEPNEEMLARARKALTDSGCTNVEFVHASSSDTGLPDRSVDVVTCGQSFHWMDPSSTLREVRRIVRAGGLFMVYDCRWPLVGPYRVQEAWCELFDNIRRLEIEAGYDRRYRYWPKAGHLKSICDSGVAASTHDCFLSAEVSLDAEQIIGLARSQGQLQSLLRHGFQEEAVGIPQFEIAVRETLGGEKIDWSATYSVQLAVISA